MRRHGPRDDEPEELPEVSPGDQVRLRGGGESEALDEPGVRLVPRGRWVAPAFLITVLATALGFLVVTVLPWLRPVHLTDERVHALFQPPLTVDGRSWSEPGDLEPDRFLTRFCGGLLQRTTGPAGRAVMSTGRGERPGNALTAAYPTAEAAESAYAELADGLATCRMRGASWERVAADPVSDGQAVGYRLLPAANSRWSSRQHLLVVQYANTVTLFMTPTPQDPQATSRAYRDRVAGVARASE